MYVLIVLQFQSVIAQLKYNPLKCETVKLSGIRQNDKVGCIWAHAALKKCLILDRVHVTCPALYFSDQHTT